MHFLFAWASFIHVSYEFIVFTLWQFVVIFVVQTHVGHLQIHHFDQIGHCHQRLTQTLVVTDTICVDQHSTFQIIFNNFINMNANKHGRIAVLSQKVSTFFSPMPPTKLQWNTAYSLKYMCVKYNALNSDTSTYTYVICVRQRIGRAYENNKNSLLLIMECWWPLWIFLKRKTLFILGCGINKEAENKNFHAEECSCIAYL